MFERSIPYVAAYTHKEPSRDDEARLLVSWLAQQSGTLAIVGPARANLERSAVAKALVARGVRYHGEKGLSVSSLIHGTGPVKVLLLWPTSQFLRKVGDSDGLSALAVLTWNLKDVETWRRATQAVDLLASSSSPVEPTLSPAVVGMLISLTNSVNLSSGLSHPLDWDSAVLGFQRLRASGHAIPPGTELEIWATSHGWYARAAHELGELADAISAGRTKRLKGGSRPYGPEIVDYWIEQSTGREDPL